MVSAVTNRDLSDIVSDSVRTGIVTAATTTATAALCGQFEDGRPIGPINAISHILWGNRAARRTGFSLKHTISGAVLNAAAVTSWAFVQEVLFGRKKRPPTFAEAMAEGAAVSALAYVTDYYVVVPEKFFCCYE